MSNISRFIGNERGDKICHEDDGCPTELAVLKRFWREQQASTLPEEVANLVELLDEEEVPYEDSLGVALSLTGRTKQYANGKTATLREQVEKLTKELDNVKQVEFPRRVQKVTDALKRKHEKELAALAEQNAKMRKVLLRLACLGNGDQYGNSIGNCIAQEALSLPDLASPVLNRIKAEAYRELVSVFRNEGRDEVFVNRIEDEADELEKTNGVTCRKSPSSVPLLIVPKPSERG